MAVDGGEATPRRRVVDIGKCNDCHSRLALHGNNRTDQPEACALCHNPNATDDRQRGGGDCVAELGTDDVSIDMKYMAHAIHAGARVDYEVCGFRNSVHRYGDVVYPGRLNNCEGCHLPGTYYPADPGERLGTTIDVGTLADPTDDTVISPNTAACYGCHADTIAVEHMRQNGGDFEAGKTADSALVSNETETCVLCHGAGTIADVEEAHGVGAFAFN